MLRIVDDRNRELFFPRPPRRIVSLVPSDTISLFDLGAGDRLVGRTRFCVEPAGRIAEVAEVGGTKDADVDAISALEPDLVIANQEENARPALEQLAQRGVTVLISFPRRVAAGIAHVARLARILGVEREPVARDLVRRGYQAVRQAAEARPERPLRVFVPIWMDPLMTLGAETFGSDMLSLAGAENVFADRVRRYPLAADLGKRAPLPADKVGERDTRYPRITLDELADRAPEAVLLPDEPHPFTDDDAAVFRAQPIPGADRVSFCDGKDLFWYGTRSIDAIDRLRRQIDSLRAARRL